MNNKLYTSYFKLNDFNIDLDNSVDYFVKYLDSLHVNFFLDTEKSKYSLMEKLIFDVVSFHANRLKININNKYISFWSKSTEYNLDYLHMHTDHCDYESRIYDTQFKKPIFTTLLYFNDNNCPTLLTDVTPEMKNNSEFMNKDNSKIGFSFPRRFKNITFDSGNYYHGESYLSDYQPTTRKVIAIALWDEINKPYHIPYFHNDLFFYYCFATNESIISITDTNKYDKNNPLLIFTNTDHNIITIKVNNTDLINNDFFHNILVKRNKKTLYNFKHFFQQFVDLDTFIFDFSSVYSNG